jgi:hypothetical protein
MKPRQKKTKAKSKSQNKVNGGGQECPPYTKGFDSFYGTAVVFRWWLIDTKFLQESFKTL